MLMLLKEKPFFLQNKESEGVIFVIKPKLFIQNKAEKRVKSVLGEIKFLKFFILLKFYKTHPYFMILIILYKKNHH